ncbi:amino acid adenylation domain-containing protein [Pseudoalteromonas sp. XMcav11-Q]|uniref:non-ribosomal peptide synthetase/type I polyketide synthase n=1 Tax=Pseudoalteromonas sp. XMcav11-Q TaxID=3136665 RepID=UPI0032C46EC4
MNTNIVTILAGLARTRSQEIAYQYFYDEALPSKTISYQELHERAASIAETLSEYFEPGDRALLLYNSGFEFIEAFFACLYAGIIAVPVYPPKKNQNVDRLRAIIEDAGAKGALTSEKINEIAKPLLDSEPSLAQLALFTTDNIALKSTTQQWPRAQIRGEQLAFLQYTSGSTGTPKGVMVTHDNILDNQALMKEAFGHNSNSAIVSWLPHFHDMGLIFGIMHPIYIGATAALMNPAYFLQKPLRWLKLLSQTKALTSSAPNFAYDLCVDTVKDEDLKDLDLSHWRSALNGAEPVRASTLERFYQKFKVCGLQRESIAPCYGMAETTLFATGGHLLEKPKILRIDAAKLQQGIAEQVADEDTVDAFYALDVADEQQPYYAVSSGVSWGEHCIAIVNPESFEACNDGETGEIWVTGPSVAKGYWNNPAATEATFHARIKGADERAYLRTGDLGFIQRGELFVTGRAKDVLIFRGKNYYPQDIELTVTQASDSLEQNGGAAFSVAANGDEERLVIVQQVKRTALRKLNAEQVLQQITAAIVEHHGITPYDIVLIKPGRIHKTSSGKIQRQENKRSYLTNNFEVIARVREEATSQQLEAPSSSSSLQQIQRLLQELVAQEIDKPARSLDIDAPFLALGVDSMKAVRISGELMEVHELDLEPTVLYEYPSIRELAQYLSQFSTLTQALGQTELNESKGTTEQANNTQASRRTEDIADTDIAVIGMACRYPLANGLDAFWQLLSQQGDGITTPDPKRQQLCPNLEADRLGGYLENVDEFDAALFGISPLEAKHIDPQHRLLLQTTYHAIQHAGYQPATLAGSNIGVYVGISQNDYFLLSQQQQKSTAYLGTGTALSIAANRISYSFNFTGPSVAIDTACSSSLVALHHAIQALRNGETNAALVAGVNLILSDDVTKACENAQMLAADGHCKTFSQAADGYVRSEGVGVVMLKPLQQAMADNDPIVGVLKGSAINQDGRSNGITAPNSAAQQAVINAALDNAKMQAGDIHYVETHGTGTELGDPIEITALNRTYGEHHSRHDPVILGAVKANIGHLESGAGIAGLIKTLLCLQHGQIPAQRYSEVLNPHIPWQKLPFMVPQNMQTWSVQQGGIRAAGLSSFGFGGTNAHVICAQAPVLEPSTQAEVTPPSFYLLPLAAKSKAALQQLAGHYSERLSSLTPQAFDDFCAQNAEQVPLKGVHKTFSGVSREALISQLNSSIIAEQSSANTAPEVALLFTGQGSQYPLMALSLYQHHAVFRSHLDDIDSLIGERFGARLLDVLFDEKHSELLAQTRWTQVSLFAVEYSLANLLMHYGVKPSLLLSHSVGEYAAACIAGVFSLRDGVELIAARGQLMHELPIKGSMIAARCDEITARNCLSEIQEQVVISAFHGEAGVVFSGADEAITALSDVLAAQQIKVKALHTANAFHSPLMAPMLEAFREVAEQVRFQQPRLPFVSSMTGQVESTLIATAEYWVEQIKAPVRFVDCVTALESLEHGLAIELGPKPILSGLLQENSNNKALNYAHVLHPKGDDSKRFAECLGTYLDLGGPLEWQQVYGNRPSARASLPQYPFDCSSYWIFGTEQSQPEALTVVDTSDRDAQIRSFVLNTLAGLLSMPANAIQTNLPLLEMGVDSLMIMQAVRVYEREFGLEFSVRQFYQELSDVDKLVAYIQSHSDYLKVPQSPQQAGSLPSPVSVTTDTPKGSAVEADNHTLVAVYQAQLQAASTVTSAEARAALEAVVGQQLRHIQGVKVESSAVTSTTTLVSKTQPSRAQSVLPGAQQKQVQRANSSPAMRQHLAALSDSYIAKTHSSKALVSKYRARLADCRASAGFRLSSKELLYPVFSKRCEGAYIWDIDDNRYIDITMDFGTNLFGHNPDFIKAALAQQLEAGMQLGLASPDAPEVAALICELTGLERASFCNSGTEAVMTALRLARTVTKRDKIVQFSGAYHGHYDGTLATESPEQGVEAMCAGVRYGAIADNLVLPYGDDEALEVITREAQHIAAVIVEPVQSRHPENQPWAFLRKLRTLTEAYGIALIFDEMITGFRAHPGGVQGLIGVKADMATYGKIVGGGMPIGVVAGAATYLDAIDGGNWQYGDDSYPLTDTTFFAGTFCKHPMTMASAKAVLQAIKSQGPTLQQGINDKTAAFKAHLNAFFETHDVPIRIEAFASLFRFRFSQNLDVFFYEMLERGVFIWEGRNCFFSAAHTDEDIAAVINAVEASVLSLKRAGYFGETSQSDDDAAFPLSHSQQQLLAMALTSSDGASAYQLQAILKLSGKLDLPRLQQAVTAVCRDFPILRFGVDSDRLMQYCRVEKAELHVEPWSEDDQVTLQTRLSALRYQPFDFAKDPLCRVTLLSDGKAQHYLSVVAHHVICDGLSLQMVLAAIAERYNQDAKQNEVASRAVSFSHYVDSLQAYSHSPEAAKNQAFWHQCLASSTPLALPKSTALSVASYQVNQLTLPISSSAIRNTETLAQFLRCGQFATMLALYCLWLHKLSGQTVISVGVPVSDRQRLASQFEPELLDQALLGYCTNILPIVVDIAGLSTIGELVQRVQNTLLDAFDHQTHPYASLADEQLILPSTLFNLDKVTTLPSFNRLEVEVQPSVAKFGQFELTTNMTCVAGQWSLLVEYHTAKFDTELMTQYVAKFVHLLSQVQGNTPIGAQNELIQSSDDVYRLVELPLQQEKSVKVATSFVETWQHNVSRCSARTALVTDDVSLSYEALDSRVNQLAHYLMKQQVTPNSIVAVALPRRAELLVALMAVMKAGAAFLPLDLTFPDERIAHILEDAKVSVVLCDASSAESALFNLGRFKRVCMDSDAEEIAKSSTRSPSLLIQAQQRAYVIYTSGSTGLPKGVEVSHGAFANLLASMCREPGLVVDDRLLAITTVAFDIALLELFGPLLVGASVVLASDESISDPAVLGALIEQQQITVMQATPTLWQLVLNAAPACTSGIKVWSGGEPLPQALAAQLLSHSKAVYNLYGPTETTIWSAVAHIDNAAEITIGKAIQNTSLFVLPTECHGEGLPLPDGVWGELYIGGSGVAMGYLHQAELTEQRFINHQFTTSISRSLYKTGDKARRLADGHFEVKGRLDNQIKLHGHRIELGDISHHLGRILNTSEVDVCVQTLETGPCLCGYMIDDGELSTEWSSPRLRQALGEWLPSYMVPEHFVWLSQWPMTPNGKRDRKALPMPAVEQVSEICTLAPRTETEKQLHQHYIALLPVEQLGVTARFVDSGGNSVIGMQLVSRLNRAFNIKLTIGDIFEHACIAELAECIEALKQAHDAISVETQTPNVEKVSDIVSDRDLSAALSDKSMTEMDL